MKNGISAHMEIIPTFLGTYIKPKYCLWNANYFAFLFTRFLNEFFDFFSMNCRSAGMSKLARSDLTFSVHSPLGAGNFHWAKKMWRAFQTCFFSPNIVGNFSAHRDELSNSCQCLRTWFLLDISFVASKLFELWYSRFNN